MASQVAPDIRQYLEQQYTLTLANAQSDGDLNEWSRFKFLCANMYHNDSSEPNDSLVTSAQIKSMYLDMLFQNNINDVAIHQKEHYVHNSHLIAKLAA